MTPEDEGEAAAAAAALAEAEPVALAGDGRHPATRSIGWALMQAARLHRARIGERLAALGLFAGQEQVIQALAVGGPMTMGELAATLRVRPPTISKAVTRLAALGVVARRSEGGRGGRAVLTEAGAQKAAAIAAIWDEVEDTLTGGLDRKDRRRLRKGLRRAARNLAPAAAAPG